ncbi:MAG: hypothetical protein AMXMBFR82_10360 [Candidatus Hydrogenedentota bacterium]
MIRSHIGRLGICIAALAISVAHAQERTINLDPPGEFDFILDRAGLISEQDKETVRNTCATLLQEQAIPIVVVTIESMAQYGPPGIRIETFATLLFDQWGIGYKEVGGQSWNRGILLLVSAQDRKARIELGADWGREFDPVCQKIMDEQIIFHFKQGNYSQGIVAGVESLDHMARGIALPTRPRPWWHYAVVAGAIGLAIFTVVSLIRRGASGWAWIFWGAVFALLGFILYQALAGSRSSGGFSGGSFGGGFSGGGGATGSW